MQSKRKINDLEPVGERARYFAIKQRVLVSNILWHFCTSEKNRGQHLHHPPQFTSKAQNHHRM